MRARKRTVLAGVALGASLGIGCSYYPYDCHEWKTCVAAPEPVCAADPMSGRPEERCGVFASSTLGDDGNPGTRERPVRTLAMAIALAQVGPARVYACAEVFAEPVELPSGVELWGGLDCAEGWAYVGAIHKTILAPEPDAVPLRVVPGAGRAVVADVRAEASSVTQPSGSSIAALVMANAAVDILRSELVAGDGADGAAGEKGGDGPAQSGADGWAGGAACSDHIVPGGPSVVTSCGALESVSGHGGEGLATAGSDGGDGEPMPAPNPLGGGLGGVGQVDAGLCGTGTPGADGADGTDGLGGIGPGAITLSGWEGIHGASGADGLRGQGGGGGGGSRGGPMFCGVDADSPKGGAAGGSGGAGGCGGKAGTGGGYGGASIGLLLLSDDVTVDATTIVAGRGGAGGAGGPGQLGGSYGVGGNGGLGMNGSLDACPGGRGGQGGHGGDGGGGLGGPSLGVAHPIGAAPTLRDVDISTGDPGTGGLGGDPAQAAGKGQDGFTGNVVAFPL